MGVISGYANLLGDPIIPLGKYYYCYSDTLREFAIVYEHGGRCIGINRKEKEQIVIEPQFDCASQFKNGKAKVSYNCKLIPDGEYNRAESKEWFYIDRKTLK